jgi:hypothetical protein
MIPFNAAGDEKEKKEMGKRERGSSKFVNGTF